MRSSAELEQDCEGSEDSTRPQGSCRGLEREARPSQALPHVCLLGFIYSLRGNTHGFGKRNLNDCGRIQELPRQDLIQMCRSPIFRYHVEISSSVVVY